MRRPKRVLSLVGMAAAALSFTRIAVLVLESLAVVNDERQQDQELIALCRVPPKSVEAATTPGARKKRWRQPRCSHSAKHVAFFVVCSAWATARIRAVNTAAHGGTPAGTSSGVLVAASARRPRSDFFITSARVDARSASASLYVSLATR